MQNSVWLCEDITNPGRHIPGKIITDEIVWSAVSESVSDKNALIFNLSVWQKIGKSKGTELSEYFNGS